MSPADVFTPAQLRAIDQVVEEKLRERAGAWSPAAEGYLGTAASARVAGVQQATIREWIKHGLPAAKRDGLRGWRIKLPTSWPSSPARRAGGPRPLTSRRSAHGGSPDL